MKCQHGNEIVIIIELETADCWDDGIVLYKSDGTLKNYPDNSDDDYVKVQCKECKVALIRIE